MLFTLDLSSYCTICLPWLKEHSYKPRLEWYKKPCIRQTVRLFDYFRKLMKLEQKAKVSVHLSFLPFTSRTYFSWFPNVPTVTAISARVIRPTVRPPPSEPLKAIRALFYRIRIKTSIILIAFCRSTCDAHSAQQKITWSYIIILILIDNYITSYSWSWGQLFIFITAVIILLIFKLLLYSIKVIH